MGAFDPYWIVKVQNFKVIIIEQFITCCALFAPKFEKNMPSLYDFPMQHSLEIVQLLMKNEVLLQKVQLYHFA